MPTPNQVKISKRPFGVLPNGKSIEAWTLTGRGGLEIEVLTYGTIVRRLLTPDHRGELADVVLGYETLDGYINDPFYMGATAGRIAGRVSKGKLMVNGKLYDLTKNEGENHLHGGPNSFNRKCWFASALERDDGAPSISLKCSSPHLENGYPGNIECEVIITVTDENAFVYETIVHTDHPTPVSLTHHSYFNLRGHGDGNILDHQATIASEQTLRCDEVMTLLDEFQSVKRTASDMRKEVRWGDAIPQLWQGHGDLYWLGDNDDLKRAATIREPHSRRTLTVHTTLSCLQTYVGPGLHEKIPAKSDKKYQPHGGFCLECEGYPQASNADGFGDIIVHPSKPQITKTVYAFNTY